MVLAKGLCLQLFADGEGASGASEAAPGGSQAAPTVETADDDGRLSKLRALGVPEDKLNKRARGQAAAAQASTPDTRTEPPAEQTAEAAPVTEPAKRLSWEEIMADPEYNRRMQETMQNRLKAAKTAEQTMQKLAPAMELLSRKYGLDPQNPDALAKAISEDNAFYEQKALDLGVPVETAKKIEQLEREAAAHKQDIERQRVQQHFLSLEQQGQSLRRTFPSFNLREELKNPAFARMTSPNVGISVEDAYYACHRREIQTAAMQVTARKTAQQLANSIRSGQNRPKENGTTGQAPSVTGFDYANASREQREALKKSIRMAAARGEKIYPGSR